MFLFSTQFLYLCYVHVYTGILCRVAWKVRIINSEGQGKILELPRLLTLCGSLCECRCVRRYGLFVGVHALVLEREIDSDLHQ